MQQNPVNFNLSWNSHENYWICVVLPEADSGRLLEKEFKNTNISGTYLGTSCYAVQAPKAWGEVWQQLKEALAALQVTNPKAAVIGLDGNRPSVEEIMHNLESIEKIDLIAQNLWLGEAILANRVECHFQPIIDRSSHPFGYESFARLRTESGEYVSGAKIIQAARAMNIEHLVDRYLHILAIKTFAEARLPGNLFINFMSGFIQLPAKYLEGLTEAAKHYNILPKRIVLDVADCENVHDIGQISSIIDYCNSKGYAVALDDINSLFSLKEILHKLNAKPDFIKLDRKIIQQCENTQIYREIWSLTELAHEKGSMILAEGIETGEVMKLLMNSSIDLFQGYHIASPMPAGDITSMKKNAG